MVLMQHQQQVVTCRSDFSAHNGASVVNGALWQRIGHCHRRCQPPDDPACHVCISMEIRALCPAAGLLAELNAAPMMGQPHCEAAAGSTPVIAAGAAGPLMDSGREGMVSMQCLIDSKTALAIRGSCSRNGTPRQCQSDAKLAPKYNA